MSWFQSSWMVGLPLLFVPVVLLAPPGPWGQVFRADPIGLVFLGFLLFLGTSVHRFAQRNLEGDPGRGRFLVSLVGTLWAVQGLAVAGNFGLFFVFWILSSLGLHRLLGHFDQRPGARIVVWEKFLISRLGDLALVGAGILLILQYQTLDFLALESAVRGGNPPSLAVALLLVLGALTKSAQVPFHAWLPRTLEAPTPVSALLHAGIINAGGLLLIRCWFLVGAQEPALLALVVVAGISAIWGGLVLMVQTDVKRRLAWSTVGQMGFMLLEIGLGAPALAFVHLMGHGLYKARAFLWSGETPRVDATVSRGPVALPLLMAVFWLGIGGAGALALSAFLPAHLPLAVCVWAAVLPLAVPSQGSPGRIARGLVLATGVSIGSVALAWGSSILFGLMEGWPVGAPALAGWAVAAGLAAGGLLVAFSPHLAPFRWYRWAYSSALHGFGFGRWPEAVVHRWFPDRTTSGASS